MIHNSSLPFLMLIDEVSNHSDYFSFCIRDAVVGQREREENQSPSLHQSQPCLRTNLIYSSVHWEALNHTHRYRIKYLIFIVMCYTPLNAEKQIMSQTADLSFTEVTKMMGREWSVMNKEHKVVRFP